MSKPVLKQVGSWSVLYVMAVEAEYGQKLRRLILPLMTGVGPVEAAVSLSAFLARLNSDGNTPSLVVSLGSAGSRTLEQTLVYQVSSVSYRDMDASVLGFDKGMTPFLELPVAVPLPIHVPGIPAASLSTGGGVISGRAYDAVEADMVDMETFAVLRACQHHGVPLVGLRGISDGADDLSHVGDWTEYLHVVDEHLAEAVELLEAALSDGLISR